MWDTQGALESLQCCLKQRSVKTMVKTLAFALPPVDHCSGGGWMVQSRWVGSPLLYRAVHIYPISMSREDPDRDLLLSYIQHRYNLTIYCQIHCLGTWDRNQESLFVC